MCVCDPELELQIGSGGMVSGCKQNHTKPRLLRHKAQHLSFLCELHTSPPLQQARSAECPYLDVGAEVGDFGATCVFQVVVSPPQQQVFGRQLHQVL